MTNPDGIQSAFLDEIRKRLATNLSFVDELAEQLSISRDSAYRRIRGETVLSLDEAKKLCERYGVSIDSLFAPTSNVVPFHVRSTNDTYTLEQWLTSVLHNTEQMTDLTYAAKDIPIFHYMRHPEVAAFKMFFWQKTIIENPEYRTLRFDYSAIPKEMIQLGNRIWSRYAIIPSTEIWAVEAINNSLKQIEFYKECNFFADPKLGAEMCDHFIELMRVVQAEATEAKKEDGASYGLYQNDILMSDNTALAHAGEKQIAYLNYNILNLLITQHPSFCDKTERYLNNLIKHSALISGSSAKERIKFFTKLTNRIEVFKATL
ncbi:MAG: helix-turn-helix transcriptional regulator [Cyclobacteriaceae bacterium]|jgi:transcriptional regulator with XRE-family HTH domain|nr:helix-turn-helix transcriptional regulator [Cyclobacteriaceae bacterium]